jgi:hypothetical protein
MSSAAVLVFFLAIIGGTLLFLKYLPRLARKVSLGNPAVKALVTWPRVILKYAGALVALCALIAAVYLIIIGLFALVTAGLGKPD